MDVNLRTLLAPIALLTFFACTERTDNKGAAPPTGPATAALSPATCAPCGPSKNAETQTPQPYQKDIYYHLAEGSELVPLVWLKALHDFSEVSDDGDVVDGGPFLDDAERFGLLPDPNAACKIPVGLTGLHSGDPRFMGIRMTGITCAACHVGEITSGDETIRVAGGPNLFDTVKFLHDAGTSAKYTATHWRELYRFIRRALRVDCGPQPQVMPTFDLGPADVAGDDMAGFVGAIYERYPTVEAFRAAGKYESAVADQLEALMAEERQREPPDMLEWTEVSRKGPYEEYLREWTDTASQSFANLGITDEMRAQRDAIREQWLGELIVPPPPANLTPSPASPFAATSQGVRLASGHQNFLKSWLRTLRMLRARVQFLQRLAAGSGQSSTWAGYGRVDAFGSARVNIFGQEVALNAPVNYPFIWGLGDRPWYHWDGNTDALRQRNIGQAMSLGAVYDEKTYESTVLFENLKTLEAMSHDLVAPKWSFTTPDSQRVAQGEKVFDAECVSCHPRYQKNKKSPLKRITLEAIGTDPQRAISFAKEVDGQCLPLALAEVVGKIMAAAKRPPEAAEWCAPQEYDSWPLDGVWATAPYLHNGSVRTIRELLKEPADRETEFYVGSREYDVNDLGYEDIEDPQRPLLFKTSETGNAATGHDYGTSLGTSDKDALIEFLKTL